VNPLSWLRVLALQNTSPMRVFLPGLLVLACSCTVAIQGSGSPSDPDAANSPDAPNGTSDAPAGGFQCRNAVANVGTGNHNAGQDCMGGCHNHGFTLSGTLFAAPTGTTPMVGASVTVVDANGATFDMVSQLNGNFYTRNVIAFPVKLTASSCPNVQPMSATVGAGSGGCNNTGCHATGAQGPIHLP